MEQTPSFAFAWLQSYPVEIFLKVVLCKIYRPIGHRIWFNKDNGNSVEDLYQCIAHQQLIKHESVNYWIFILLWFYKILLRISDELRNYIKTHFEKLSNFYTLWSVPPRMTSWISRRESMEWTVQLLLSVVVDLTTSVICPRFWILKYKFHR